MKKHAYLIMAHHRPDLLRELLDAIDDERNDIYIHIDVKSKDVFDTCCKFSRVYLMPSMDVRWGGYSQVECEYKLLKSATQNGNYWYYHLLTGSTYPLKSQNEIHALLEEKRCEFIGFDEKADFSSRVRYYYWMSEYGKTSDFCGKIVKYFRMSLCFLQKKIGIDRLQNCKDVIKKGLVYWSITDSFARYVISKENAIRLLLKDTISGDEIFMQTLSFNSTYRECIYDIKDEFRGAMREVAWEDAYGGARKANGHNFSLGDFEILLNSDKLFALKFEGEDGLELISKIRASWQEKS